MNKDILNDFTKKLTKIPPPPKSLVRAILKETFEMGRLDVLNEWEEERERFLAGFSWKKKK